jgi:peptide/nickel transport system substrate-binding protein
MHADHPDEPVDRRVEEVLGRRLSRRQVLRLGVAAAGVTSLPALLAACGEGGDATTAAADATATAAGTTAGETGATTAADAGTPKRGGRLRLGLVGAGTTETLDPAKSVQEIDEAIARQLNATLTILRTDFSPEPYLAESVEPNADGTTWQVKIREGATFHDGKPVTPEDILWTFRRVVDPKTASAGASYLEGIDLRASKRVSATELSLVFKQPRVDIDQTVGLRELSILPEGTKDFTKYAGAGPFQLVSWRPGQRGEWRRYDGFFLDGQPYVDELETIGIEDAQARLNALLGGQVDAMSTLEFAQARAQEGSDDVIVTRSNSALCWPFCMDTTAPEFSDPRVREAMKLAVDREKLLQAAYLGFGRIGNDTFGIGSELYNEDLPQREYDPERAKALLAEAGKSDLRVELSAGASPSPAASLTYAQSAKAAGITLDVKRYGADRFFTDAYMKKPLFESQWSGPWNLFVGVSSAPGAVYNETKFVDKEFSDAYTKMTKTVDPDERKRLFGDLYRIQYERGGYIVPAFADNLDAVSPNLRGVPTDKYFNRLGGYHVREAWLA